ncbi:Arc family DNA-binding protein [Aureimonas pseudogalii]|uniref:Putative transcriptional regulator n=1 Tax=Aureimonas pseudogalii TaxID=1744844 RepID=A0A7W6EA91_9HYPH|nr:Arc family DNA-binding protein [Aureimonas pseudogalii]MBB3997179.1 putative transcriptional regulator [Aureimonas pseudogalii]
MTEAIRNIPPFGVRLPADIKRWIEDVARRDDRSQNYVIVQTIRERMAREATGQGSKANSPAASEHTGGLVSAGNVHSG